MSDTDYTANQALQLLWIHYEEPQYELRLSVSDLATLEYLIVVKYEELTTPYVHKLIPETMGSLVDWLMENKGKSPFNK